MKIFKVLEKMSESSGWEWNVCEEEYYDSYEKARAAYKQLVYSHGGMPVVAEDQWTYSGSDGNFQRIITLAVIEIK